MNLLPGVCVCLLKVYFLGYWLSPGFGTSYLVPKAPTKGIIFHGWLPNLCVCGRIMAGDLLFCNTTDFIFGILLCLDFDKDLKKQVLYPKVNFERYYLEGISK